MFSIVVLFCMVLQFGSVISLASNDTQEAATRGVPEVDPIDVAFMVGEAVYNSFQTPRRTNSPRGCGVKLSMDPQRQNGNKEMGAALWATMSDGGTFKSTALNTVAWYGNSDFVAVGDWDEIQGSLDRIELFFYENECYRSVEFGCTWSMTGSTTAGLHIGKDTFVFLLGKAQVTPSICGKDGKGIKYVGAPYVRFQIPDSAFSLTSNKVWDFIGQTNSEKWYSFPYHNDGSCNWSNFDSSGNNEWCNSDKI